MLDFIVLGNIPGTDIYLDFVTYLLLAVTLLMLCVLLLVLIVLISRRQRLMLPVLETQLDNMNDVASVTA
jgi:hypothetical protein